MTFTSGEPKSWRPYPAFYEGMYIRRTSWVEEHVALSDARLLEQQPLHDQRLAHGLGQLAVVAREAAGQVGELGVEATPLAHAVEPLQDPARHAPRGIRVVVGPRRLRWQCVEDRLLVLRD